MSIVVGICVVILFCISSVSSLLCLVESFNVSMLLLVFVVSVIYISVIGIELSVLCESLDDDKYY